MKKFLIYVYLNREGNNKSCLLEFHFCQLRYYSYLSCQYVTNPSHYRRAGFIPRNNAVFCRFRRISADAVQLAGTHSACPGSQVSFLDYHRLPFRSDDFAGALVLLDPLPAGRFAGRYQRGFKADSRQKEI